MPEQGTDGKLPIHSSKDYQQQYAHVPGTNNRASETSEFQRFVRDATGKVLPIFGAEFFANAPATFAPIQNSPVPSDYPLGPGDEVLIRGWGTVEIDYRATIDRNGLVNVPTIGSIVLGGVRAGDAEAVIRGAIAKYYKGVTLNVTFGQLRAITVYVVGQARRPGTYTVSSMSTLVTALFASGGPNANGSMRRVQVKRGGKVAAELDLYAFIAKGDKAGDAKLQDGDTIFIPAVSGYVALTGSVNSPAIYELRTADDTVELMLDFAGGLPVVADPRRAFLERIDPQQRQPRRVEELALDSDGLKKTLKNGDLLTILSVTPEFANAITLRGNVDQPIRVPFKSGMRVSDLIPSREFLVTRASVQRQNQALLRDEDNHRELQGIRDAQGNRELSGNREASGNRELQSSSASLASRIGNMIDPINWDYAALERVNRADLSTSLIPFNLGKALDNPVSQDNIALQPGDIVTVFSQNDVRVPIAKQRVFVRVEGEVNVPGVYQMSSGENLIGLLGRAGGPTGNAYLFGTEFYREQVYKEQQANLEKVIRRLEAQVQSATGRSTANTISLDAADAQQAEVKRQAELESGRAALVRMRELRPTGRITFGLDPTDRSFNKLPAIKLQNGDRLVIPSKPDVVHIYGAVNQESSVLWRPGMTVGSYVNNAGPTNEADLDSMFLLRADGSVVSAQTGSWLWSGISSVEVMPGDSIVLPEKIDKQTAWTKFIKGAKDWAQIFSGFGLGAAAIKSLR